MVDAGLRPAALTPFMSDFDQAFSLVQAPDARGLALRELSLYGWGNFILR